MTNYDTARIIFCTNKDCHHAARRNEGNKCPLCKEEGMVVEKAPTFLDRKYQFRQVTEEEIREAINPSSPTDWEDLE